MTENEIVIQVSGDPRMVRNLQGWALTTGIVCPACGEGVLMWAENGYVPGYRICSYCGRGWDAAPEEDGVHIRIPIMSRDGTEVPEWEFPEEWSSEWAENGDGADKARAHTWRVHGGGTVIHTDEECDVFDGN